MRLSRRNRNYVGTHFGGNLYSMCDPWYMLILMERLGPSYLVWDKAARIDFVRPGTGLVRARFTIPEDAFAQIQNATAEGNKHHPVFETEVLDEAGEVVARVEKTLYVRRKKSRS